MSSDRTGRSVPVPFDLLAEIPDGVTVLEASAGTGKTYTIAGLATRFVAEGVPLAEMLLVTFTRMATGELRERVRGRLIETERRLTAAVAGVTLPGGDGLDRALATGPPEVVELRRGRLADALSDFDAATIETTHTFCREMLAELGTLADHDPLATVTERHDDILSDLVDDLYVRRYAPRRSGESGPPALTRAQALTIARASVENPDANLIPHVAPGEPPAAAQRWRLAALVRGELDARKRSLGVITFDDLLRRLLATLTGENGDAAVQVLRRRYRIVLIDEFQDTDPTQWNIVRRAFADGARRVVLIADPKQAIYAFRGADVFAYLGASRTATATATLSVNHRSDEHLLAGLDALFAGVNLGHPEIAYRRVAATPDHRGSRLRGAPSTAALRFRVLDRRTVQLTRNGYAQTEAARDAVAVDVAADIVALLGSGATAPGRRAGGPPAEGAIGPGDIAVLVDKHRNAARILDALDAAGVPGVVGGAGSVFSTPAAEDWRALLEALERPSSPVRARTAALGSLVGWPAQRLADADQGDLEDLHGALFRWSRRCVTDGTAAMTQALMAETAVAARLLRHPGGERRLTDLTHVAELLHRAAAEEQLGLSALAGWLRERITAAGQEGAHGDERTRRLDSDAAAVQILTIHRAKGLEWPVVYCPFLWDLGWTPSDPRPARLHRDGARALDVTLEGDAYQRNRAQALQEDRGEDLRLAYVALTRARHAAVVHWAGSFDARNAPLTRLLFARDAQGDIATGLHDLPTDQHLHTALQDVAARAEVAGVVGVEWVGPDAGPAHWGGPPPSVDELDRAHLGRRLDLSWRRTSYSALTAPAHERPVGSEPELVALGDEPEVTPEAVLDPGDAPDPDGTDLPLATMAFGPAVGTVIHDALERADFTAPELVAELTLRLVEAAGSRGVGILGCPVAQVAAGLATALATPIAGLDGRPLAGRSRRDRLDELSFELPLSGGDSPVPTRAGTLADLADVLEAHLEPSSPLVGYPARLRDPLLAADLRGYLTGSIDLVLRHTGPDGRTRYAVIDYKTNWLAPAGLPLTARQYAPAVLGPEMQRTHYVLQGLLYSVALHRFLRWRLGDYDPARHLGGMHYLFLRGMTGRGDAGIFSHVPPAGLVPALSDLLDGTRP